MMVNSLRLPTNWSSFFNGIKNKDYFKNLLSFLENEYSSHICYPKYENIFKAFELVNPKDIKVVILGQDPYSNPNQAQGLAFSVASNTPLPPSLINIYKEIEYEFNIPMDYRDGDLTYLATQGVFLINTILSCRANSPLSHDINEYRLFISDLFDYLNSLSQPLVYMLWGNYALKYDKLIDGDKTSIIKTSHPSPLSANRGGWFYNNQFLSCNDYLIKNGQNPINWNNSKLFK